MRKLFIGMFAVATLVASADMLWIKTTSNVNSGIAVSDVGQITMDNGTANVKVVNSQGQSIIVPRTELVNIAPQAGISADVVTVIYDASGASVYNPFAFDGVEIENNAGHVTVRNNSGKALDLTLSGSIANGGLKVYSETELNVTLNGVDITNGSGSALNFQTEGDVNINIAGTLTNTLCDAKKYQTPADEKENGTIHAGGALTFNGNGSLNITAIKKHGINAATAITVNGGNITVDEAASDAFHTEAFEMTAGKIVTNSAGDGIDAGAGTFNISGGELTVNITADDTKGIKADDKMNFKGGNIALNISGPQSKGIKSKKKITVDGATITGVISGEVVVLDGDASYSTGIKTDKSFEMKSGKLDITATGAGGKCVSADGDITLSGGEIILAAKGENGTYTDIEGATDTYAGACLSSDANVTVSGADLTLTVTGNSGKGIKADGDVLIASGTINGTLSGNCVVTAGNPSYCSGIKTDGNFTMDGGNLHFEHTGMGGKGISVDGNGVFNGGDITINCSGNGSQFTDPNGTADCYFSTSISVDGTLDILGGTFNLTNKGTAGKCIKSDMDMILGAAGTAGPSITASTSGARISVSSTGSSGSTGGGTRPGGRPGGGWGGGFDNGDYSNPKIIKADGNLTVNSGTYNLKGSTEGGEGLESKKTLTVNGGDITINVYDDGMNATSAIVINGGRVFSYASNNDGIDSNGTLTINGGLVVAMGAQQPECGFDCDNNRFAITGGTLIGIGGSNSSPTASACTQAYTTYSGSISNSTQLTLVDNNGNMLFSFKSPRSYNGNAQSVISAQGLSKGQTVKLYTGGTITGGETFNGMTTGGTYTPGTLVKTINL